jgi:hypothetical protein
MKAQTKLFFLVLLSILIFSKFVMALPTAPSINYISNTSATTGLFNRSVDIKGTITTITLDANQQDYKWKAYVGNVTGKVALDNANGQSIYDWNLGTSGGGEVYVSKYSNINWNNISCVDQPSIDAEQASLSMSAIGADNINSTFNFTNHRSFNVGANSGLRNMSGCRSTATYINDTAQAMGSGAFFQEILLRDSNTGNMVYATFIESAHQGYDNQQYDFQLLVAENESATVPTLYYFWVELGG